MSKAPAPPPREFSAGASPASPVDPVAGHEQALRALLPSREALLAEVQRSRRKRQARTATLGLAAALAVVVALDPPLAQEHIATAVGEQRRLELPDGSSLQLNTASAVVVQTHLRSRQFRLLHGEAFFTVAHSWRPFYVHHAQVRVEDIGTRFVTRAQEDGLRVTVTEGAVEVRQAQDRVLLTTDQGLLARPGHVLEPLTDQRPPSWIAGRLAFEGVPLRDAMAELQRYRTGRITLDPAAAQLRLTADYDVAGVEELLRSLPAFLPVALVPGPSGQLHIQRTQTPSLKNSSL